MNEVAQHHEAADEQAELVALSDSDLNEIDVNERVMVRDDPGLKWRVIVVSGRPFVAYPLGDEHSEPLACVALHSSGLALQAELVAAFGHSRSSQIRWEKKYVRYGAAGLLPYRPKGRPASISSRLEALIVRLHGRGFGMQRIAQRLGVSKAVVRGVYKRKGLRTLVRGGQESLPFGNGMAGDLKNTDNDSEPDGLEGPDQKENADIEFLADGEEALADEAGEPWDGWLIPQYESAQGVSRDGQGDRDRAGTDHDAAEPALCPDR